METTYKRIASATVQTAHAGAKHVTLMDEANNMALFTILLGNLNTEAEHYFTMRRAMVLREMEKDAEAQLLNTDAADDIRALAPTNHADTRDDGDDIVVVDNDATTIETFIY